jgi:hypothetical protein
MWDRKAYVIIYLLHYIIGILFNSWVSYSELSVHFFLVRSINVLPLISLWTHADAAMLLLNA